MTNEEWNRKVEFLVEWQAQFAADIQVLKERQDRFQIQLEAQAATADTALELSTKVAEATTDLIRTHAEQAKAQAKAQAKTDRQLDRLARLIEAHVRDGHRHDTPTS
jgi:hypothetical protein